MLSRAIPSLCFVALAASACATEGTDEVTPDDLEAALCDAESGLDCTSGKADAVQSLVSAYFDHGGDLAAAGQPPVARYRARMHSAQTVYASDGSQLAGLSALAHCFWDPDDCRVALEAETYFENVSVGNVLDALYGDWRLWWRHSQLAGDFNVLAAAAPGPGGELYRSTQFRFQPLGETIGRVSLVDIDMTLLPPRPTAGGFVVPIHMNGPAFSCATAAPCMTLTVTADGGKVRLVERWGTEVAEEKMTITGALKRFPAVAAVLHRWAGESNPILRPTLSFDPLGGETGWVGLADFLEARRHPELGAIPFADQIHDTAGDALRVTKDAGGYVIEGGTTVDRIAAPPSRVLAALFGDWSCWWRHSEVANLRPILDASGKKIAQSYDLTPVAFAPLPPLTQVRELMKAPVRVYNTGWTEGPVWRIEIELQGAPGTGAGNSFVGAAHFDVQQRADGTTRLVARFDRVRPLGIYGATQGLANLATKLHAMGEQGALPPPARGTGLPGLVQFVALGKPLRDDAACLAVLQ